MQSQPNPNQAHPFSADRPIEHSASDLLRRAPFAIAIAEAVSSWREHDSLVIALYGAYGTGKTSIKNLILEEICSTQPNTALIIEFNPWQFAGQTSITQAFFDEVGKAVGKGTIASGADKRKLLERWERYAAFLKGGSSIIDALRKPIAIALTAAAAVLGLNSIKYSHTLSWFLTAIAVIAAIFAWLSGVADTLLGVIRARVLHPAITLKEARDELAASLRKLKTPILVVLDDLDRLTPAELLETFQLVKVNADFPNLVFLLLLHRTIASEHVQQILKVDGQEYLEKIVQVGFDLPMLTPADIHAVLFRGLDLLLTETGRANRFSKERWGNIFLGALQHYFENLRHVNRFLSTLSFHFALLQGARSLEVNPVDLIGLEAVRVFNPPLYQALQSHKAILTRTQGATSQKRDVDAAKIRDLTKLAPADRQGHTEDLIRQLFPTIDWVFGGSHYDSEFEQQWVRDLRVCSAEIFDRYFAFTISEGDIPQSALDQLIDLAGNRDALSEYFQDLDTDGLLNSALKRLEAYKQHLPIEHTRPFVTALFDVGDQLRSDGLGFLDISPAMHAVRIIYWYLRTDSDTERRKGVLKTAIQETTGVRLPVDFISLEDQRTRSNNNLRNEVILDGPELANLRALCVQKIADAANQGRLLQIQDSASLLYIWRQWTDEATVRSSVISLLQDPRHVPLFLAAFVRTATSRGLENYVGRHHRYIQISELERFTTLATIEDGLATLDVSSLPDRQQESVVLFRKAQDRRKAGKPDYGTDGRYGFDD